MKVEKVQESDINTLTELRMEYLVEDHGSLRDEDRNRILDSLPEYFRAHLNRDLFCFVVREGSDIVSCAFLLVVEKPMSPAFINGRTGTVLNVYTRPAYRRRGYAGAVMKQLIEDAEELNLSVVELKATDAGYPLYRSVGFTDDDSGYHLMKRRSRKHL